jgi:uncharacterized protein YyaL (SSP411 family)
MSGGFFFTSHDHERLIHRPKPGHDNATPAGNGVAAWALNRLAFLSGETRFQGAAERALALFWPDMKRHPAGYGSLLAALEETLRPPRTVIVNGPPDDFAVWRESLRRDYLPDAVVLFVHGDNALLPPPLAKPAGERVNAQPGRVEVRERRTQQRLGNRLDIDRREARFLQHGHPPPVGRRVLQQFADSLEA